MVKEMIDKGWISINDKISNLHIQRIGRPEEIASAVLWLCGPGAGFMIGQAPVVDDGLTVQ